MLTGELSVYSMLFITFRSDQTEQAISKRPRELREIVIAICFFFTFYRQNNLKIDQKT